MTKKQIKPKIPCQHCYRTMQVKRVYASCINSACTKQFEAYEIADLLQDRLSDGFIYCDFCGGEIADYDPSYSHAGGNFIICQECENKERS